MEPYREARPLASGSPALPCSQGGQAFATRGGRPSDGGQEASEEPVLLLQLPLLPALLPLEAGLVHAEELLELRVLEVPSQSAEALGSPCRSGKTE